MKRKEKSIDLQEACSRSTDCHSLSQKERELMSFLFCLFFFSCFILSYCQCNIPGVSMFFPGVQVIGNSAKMFWFNLAISWTLLPIYIVSTNCLWINSLWMMFFPFSSSVQESGNFRTQLGKSSFTILALAIVCHNVKWHGNHLCSTVGWLTLHKMCLNVNHNWGKKYVATKSANTSYPFI